MNNFVEGRLDLRDLKRVSANIEADYKRSRLEGGELLVTLVGSIGQVAIAPDEIAGFNVARAVGVVPIADALDTHWAFYMLATPSAQDFIHNRANTTVQATFNLGDLARLSIPYPSRPVRQAVVDLLSCLDDKIALNRRTAGTLEGIARALFQSWFVDFDPVRRAAAGEEPGLPTQLAALFPTTLTRDGLPEGWIMGTISKLAAINPTTRLASAPTVPYVEMAALPTSGSRVTRVAQRPLGSGARFTNGDTLIARITPCLENGKTALVDCLRDGTVGWGSTEFIVLRPHTNIPRALPYLIARHESFRTHLIAAMSGTSGRQRVQADAVDRWEIAIPHAPVLRVFNELVDPIFERLKVLGEESDTLAALRDTLLPKLISSELRVHDAETIAAGA